MDEPEVELAGGVEEEVVRRPAWIGKPPLPGGRCARCGGWELSSLPTFSVGSGIAFRPQAEDVFCRRCGFIAPPRF